MECTFIIRTNKINPADDRKSLASSAQWDFCKHFEHTTMFNGPNPFLNNSFTTTVQ